MRVIKRATLVEFWEDAKSPRGSEGWLTQWLALTRGARWTMFADVKRTFRTADQVGNCVVFNVGGNHLRLIARIRYGRAGYRGRVFVLRVMTHAEYDRNTWPDDCGCHKPPPKKAPKKT